MAGGLLFYPQTHQRDTRCDSSGRDPSEVFGGAAGRDGGRESFVPVFNLARDLSESEQKKNLHGLVKLHLLSVWRPYQPMHKARPILSGKPSALNKELKILIHYYVDSLL